MLNIVMPIAKCISRSQQKLRAKNMATTDAIAMDTSLSARWESSLKELRKRLPISWMISDDYQTSCSGRTRCRPPSNPDSRRCPAG